MHASQTDQRKDSLYSDREAYTPEQWATWHTAELVALIAGAYDDSAEFRARMDASPLSMGDIRTLADFARIPVLRKKDLARLQDKGRNLAALIKGPLGGLSRIYQSPGSIYDPEPTTPNSWGWTEAFWAAGFRHEDLCQMTFGYHLTPAGLMLEQPLREIGCAVIPAGPGNTATQLELLTHLPVTGFIGMTSYLDVIADKAEAAGLDLAADFSLEVAFVAAERLPESLRTKVESRLGMRVRQGYGTADMGCIAYECVELGGMHISPRAYVEICDPVTGEPLPAGEVGEVVVTAFNPAYPLIRFATGDLSRLDVTPCACGRTAPKLAGILGRADDTAKVKGQFIYPAQVAEVVAGYPAISNFQIRVQNPQGRDHLVVVLESADALGMELVDEFVCAFQNRCKLRPQVQMQVPGTLAAEAPKLVDERTFE